MCVIVNLIYGELWTTFPLILWSTLTLFSSSCMWLIFIKRSCLPCILNFLLYEVQAFPSGTRHWHKLPFFVRSKKKKVCEEIDSLLFPQRYSRCCSRLGIPNHPLTYYSSHSSVTLRPNNIIYIYRKNCQTCVNSRICIINTPFMLC